MQINGHVLLPAALLIATFFTLVCEAQPAPLNSQPNYYSDVESEPDPEAVYEILARIGQSIIRARDNIPKRGMDLGLSRGYSGSLTAKHLMGLASANYASGPGRRRRSVAQV
ncbi:diuretic hormone class 2 [Arctopsyche grandis]|uniref:diuretic hormone class 2 n=1 Tax=Arctopsyche grandis TaxID=121162 RepID=UPI00406D9D6B